jgi:hypothetical protein
MKCSFCHQTFLESGRNNLLIVFGNSTVHYCKSCIQDQAISPRCCQHVNEEGDKKNEGKWKTCENKVDISSLSFLFRQNVQEEKKEEGK